ncbi:MAG: hypothetical protein Q7R66_18430 [Undibacterium sp.]|uniref:hypothetical protein n=1 Tax=Undibacterium sp. TaxID=1914977 RepID=UPI0027158922|nr:hypothetical protein [Undibacterium sp.]MDO8654153.1 hypothetical protein [Undibacterium sp.]
MYTQLLQILFSEDHRFLTLRAEGIPDTVSTAMMTFWSDPAYQSLQSQLKLTPSDWPELIGLLQELADGHKKADGLELWSNVAVASEGLVDVEPVAAVLVALQAMAAWVGGLGKNLFFQPWEGHHPGWHLFPLIVARNLVAAEAIYSARFVCETASGFVESAKGAPFDLELQRVIANYESVLASAEQIHNDCVDELAWTLHANATAQETSFRAELAALFWTAGDVIHAELLSPRGPADYLPPYTMVRSLVDQNMRTLSRNPLIQYIWLEMKDRGPFDLRQHRVLFASINNCFHCHPLHQLDDMAPMSLCQAYARVVIGALRGRVEETDRRELFGAMAILSGLVKSRAPDAYLRIAALTHMLSDIDAKDPLEEWSSQASMAADIVQWADRNGIYDPFERVLDIPFYGLNVDSIDALEKTMDSIEAYRLANLGYWLTITPPFCHENLPSDLLEQEQMLLRELRGARFIRLLPHLPSHYKRYGFRIDEALDGPPTGAQPVPDKIGLLGFDPFDQETGKRILNETWKQLEQLHEQMRITCPSYAQVRAKPPSSAGDFVSALRSHHI